jgi:hypothetical protein
MAESDVLATRITATGVAVNHRARLKSAHVVTGGGAARLTLTDGDGGPTVLDIDFVANQGTEFHIPSSGLLFQTTIHVATLTNVTFVTLFHA